MWCVATIDDEYKRCMNDVLATYERPYDPLLPVICLDEKLVELRASTRAGYRHKGVRHTDYEYRRCGTANLFVMTEPKSGQHWVKTTARRTRLDFAHVLRDVAARYGDAITIHLVMDNLKTHTEKSLIDAFGNDAGRQLWARFTMHYTPKHASWLNQAEIAISMLAKCCLGRLRFETLEQLRSHTTVFCQEQSRRRTKLRWNWTRKDAKRWLILPVTKY